MELILYCEVDGICLFILTLLYLNLNHHENRMPDEKLFSMLLSSVAAELVVDGLTRLVDGTAPRFLFARWANGLCNIAYFVLTGLISFVWMLYIEYRIRNSLPEVRRLLPVVSIPFMMLLAASITAPFNGWLFFIDADNRYQRGNLYWLQVLVSGLYLIYGAVRMYLHARANQNVVQRRDELMVAFFGLAPLTGGLLQTAFYGVPLVWPCTVCMLLIVFINFQNSQISLDALTGISNRGQLNRYLQSKAEAELSRSAVFLILIDVDHFKRINDTFGHASGDLALVSVAEILRTVCQQEKRGDFLARYGGDEFAVVCERHSLEDIERMCEAIRTEASRVNALGKAPYEIQLSIGIGRLNAHNTQGVENLIVAADADMYRNKKIRHAQQEAEELRKKRNLNL